MGTGQCTRKCFDKCRAYNGIARKGEDCNDCGHPYSQHADVAPKKTKRANVDSDEDDESNATDRGGDQSAGDDDESSDSDADPVSTVLSNKSIKMKPKPYPKSFKAKDLAVAKAEVSNGLRRGKKKRSGQVLFDLALRDAAEKAKKETGKRNKVCLRTSIYQPVPDFVIQKKTRGRDDISVGEVFLLPYGSAVSKHEVPEGRAEQELALAGLIVRDDDVPSFSRKATADSMSEYIRNLFPRAIQHMEGRLDEKKGLKKDQLFSLLHKGTGRSRSVEVIPGRPTGADCARKVVGKNKSKDTQRLYFVTRLPIPKSVWKEWKRNVDNDNSASDSDGDGDDDDEAAPDVGDYKDDTSSEDGDGNGEDEGGDGDGEGDGRGEDEGKRKRKRNVKPDADDGGSDASIQEISALPTIGAKRKATQSRTYLTRAAKRARANTPPPLAGSSKLFSFEDPSSPEAEPAPVASTSTSNTTLDEAHDTYFMLNAQQIFESAMSPTPSPPPQPFLHTPAPALPPAPRHAFPAPPKPAARFSSP
ncbi:hypothetical protein AURDEDRAFT_122288 [Auricularia subglabra TFB-10046 SS5]|nr:hypothetical protein AURDEDRAFT_122288 [Auricularia subglabra TFB-10046 SS5]